MSSPKLESIREGNTAWAPSNTGTIAGARVREHTRTRDTHTHTHTPTHSNRPEGGTEGQTFSSLAGAKGLHVTRLNIRPGV